MGTTNFGNIVGSTRILWSSPSPPPSRAHVAGRHWRKSSPVPRDEGTERKNSLCSAVSPHRRKNSSVREPPPHSPEPTRKELRGCLGQETQGVRRKNSQNPAVSPHRCKNSSVRDSTPHSPEPTRKELRGCLGRQAVTSPRTAATSPSPRSARLQHAQERAAAVRRAIFKSRMDRAVSGASSRPDLRSKAALLARKRQDLPAVNKAMRRAVDRDQAVDFLAVHLPDYALAAAVGYTVEWLQQDPAKGIAPTPSGVPSSWCHGSMSHGTRKRRVSSAEHFSLHCLTRRT